MRSVPSINYNSAATGFCTDETVAGSLFPGTGLGLGEQGGDGRVAATAADRLEPVEPAGGASQINSAGMPNARPISSVVLFTLVSIAGEDSAPRCR